MLNLVLFLLDWILLSSFWLFPSALANVMTEFVAHPFTTSVATTKNSLAAPHKKQILMASRTVKNLSLSEPRLPSYAWGDGSVGMHTPAITPEDFHGPLHDEYLDFDDESVSDDDTEQEHYHLPQLEEQQSKHPVMYRYFAKSRSRLRNQDSIPFIFLGPSVDHWKIVGQNLASRGFSVMAASLEETDQDHEKVVEAILEALRWNRAILVGCDGAAVLAIRAALRLAPEGRVAGLILCGDLTDVQTMTGDVDHFLGENLKCPFSVIWDGDKSTIPGAEDATGDNHRCLIRGGGSAPHLRLPEQFAWALTRFVEERVAPVQDAVSNVTSRRFRFMDRQLLTPGGLLVAGRVLAEAVFYVSALRVVIYQYENIYDGMLRINKGYKALAVRPRGLLKLFWEVILGLSGLSTKKGMITCEPPIEEITVLLPQREEEEQPQEAVPEPQEVDSEPQEVVPEPPMDVPEPPREDTHWPWPIPLLNPVAV